tara:strand:+ start:6968 stop:8914 length:1947 start_codon:yes stop_codon:yes gene_type:complete
MAQDIKTKVIVEAELDNKDYIKSLDKQEKAQEKTNKSTEEGAEATAGLTGALDGMLGQLGLSTAGLKGMSSGIGSSIKGLKSFKIALASTGIGLLIVALGALFAWFNRTSEGQEKMREITAGLGAAFDVLMDTLADLGKLLFETFSNPKKAMEDFSTAIKKNVMDKIDALFDGLGLLGSAIVKVFKGDFEGALEDAGKGMQKIVVDASLLGDAINFVGDAAELVKEKISEVVEETGKAVAIQESANKLKRDQIAFLTTEAKLQVKISEDRQNANDKENFSNAERLESIREAISLTKELQGSRKVLLEEELEQLIKKNLLGHNTLEDIEAEEQLKRQIILLDKEQADGLKLLISQQSTLSAQVQAEADAKQKVLDDAKAKEDERTLTAEQKLEEAKLKRREEDALEIEDAQVQSDALLLIEQERYAAELESKKLNDAEKLLLDFEYQQKTDKIKDDAASKQKTLDKAEKKNRDELIESQTLAAAEGLAEQFGLGKEFALASTVVNAAQGIGKTIANIGMPAAIPFIISQGLLVATQVANIKKAERGMMIGGKRHSQGGTLIEAEQGEVVINRNSVRMFGDLLSDINIAGGGIPLAERGIAVAETGSRAISSNLGNDITTALSNNPPVLVTEDLISVLNRLDITEDISTL